MSDQPDGRRPVNRFAAGDSDVIVIIGSGAGGGALASELCRKGAKVVLLEAGRHHQPEDFINGARRAGYTGVSTGRMAFNTVPRDGRPATIQDGFNYQGDKQRAHWSTLTAEIPKANRTGRLDLRPGSMAIRIEHDDSGRVTGVVYVDAGAASSGRRRASCASCKPRDLGWGPVRIAQAWDTLMKRLGYQSYVAQGGDWGAIITDLMGVQAPAGLLGIHTNMAGAVPADAWLTLVRNVFGAAARRHQACRRRKAARSSS